MDISDNVLCLGVVFCAALVAIAFIIVAGRNK